LDVLHAYIGGFAALIILAWFGSGQQNRLHPILVDPLAANERVDWGSLAAVLLMLLAAVGTNVSLNLWARHLEHLFPWIGFAVWVALLIACLWRPFHRASLPNAAKGALFLICLVLTASLMPVDQLPAPSMASAAGLGVISSVFDNIPLTALALKQGGYDWGMLAFAVGFGGSMVWFGSSAGVAVASQFHQARSVGLWLRHGWYIPIAYAFGLGVMYLLLGWHPHEDEVVPVVAPTTTEPAVIVP
jgi:hypothetical protein